MKKKKTKQQTTADIQFRFATLKFCFTSFHRTSDKPDIRRHLLFVLEYIILKIKNQQTKNFFRRFLDEKEKNILKKFAILIKNIINEILEH